MSKPVPRRMRVATILGLVTASLVCLCGGFLLAVTYEGLPRLLFAGAGFSGYLFFFAHALQELSLPSVMVDGRPAPDGEVRRETRRRKTMGATIQKGALRAAA